LNASIALVIDRDQNQLFCLATAAHSERFSSIRYTASPALTSIRALRLYVPYIAL